VTFKAADVPLVDIAQRNTLRLIPTAYFKPPVLRALVDNDKELSALEQLEAYTSRRLVKSDSMDDFDRNRFGRSHIEAAFTYNRKGGNRFSDETMGAWYAGFNERTAIEEVAFHKSRELSFTNCFDEVGQYQGLYASFIGQFHRIKKGGKRPLSLHEDVDKGYPAGQALARDLVAQKSRGLIYPSVRHKGGTCIVAFQPNVIQDVLLGPKWQITWDGSPDWTAEAV